MIGRQPADVSVPLLDLQAQYRPIRDEVLRAITRVADSQHFILGPEVDAFERDMAERLEVSHVVGVSSGTDALLAALMALGIGPDDEVITPTYSFFATAGCIARLGARPVFVDVEPSTLNVDPAAIERVVSPRTRAILVVHLFGLAADMDPIMTVARRLGVPVVEDAAQAIGARYRGSPAGTIGTVGCFSFFPSKNLGGFGDGGMVVTNDAALAHDIRVLRNHGMDPKYVHTRVGGNFRLDALQAAVLRVKAPYLERWTEARRRNADRYRALMDELGLSSRFTLPIEPANRTHIYNQFVIRGEQRDALREYLNTRHVGTEVYYPIPLHRQTCFESLAVEADCPVADRASTTSLALPIFGELTADQQRHVVRSIADFVESTS